MNMKVRSCQLVGTASIHSHTYITTRRRPVCPELHAIAMQNSCMNVPIIKLTCVAKTQEKWFSPNLKTTGKPCANVEATSDTLRCSCSSKPCTTSVGAIFNHSNISQACLCACAWSSIWSWSARSSRDLCAQGPGAAQKSLCHRNSTVCIQMYAWDPWTRLHGPECFFGSY